MKTTSLKWMLFALFFNLHDARDAIQTFIKNKKIHNFTISILQDLNNSESNWFEYKYYFDNANSSEKKFVNKFEEIRVGLFPDDNFECKTSNQENGTEVEGYAIDVMKNLEEILNIRVKFIILNRNITTPLYLSTNYVDLIICSFYQGDYQVTQLYPIMKGKYVAVYKYKEIDFTKDIFILTFTGHIWLVFLILLVLLAICLRFATVQYSRFHSGYDIWSWVEITLWGIATACQQGLSYCPDGFASRTIFLTGYLTAYFLYTCFEAVITSLLLQNKMYYKLDYSSSTVSNKLRLICIEHLACDLSSQFKSTQYVANMTTLFTLLDEEDTVGIGPGEFVNQYIATKIPSENIDQYLISEIPGMAFKLGYLVNRNSTLELEFNKQILKMEEVGILKNLLSRHLEMLPQLELNYGYSSAGVEHVGSAILILLAGILVALIFLIAEIIFAFYRRQRLKRRKSETGTVKE